MKPSCFVPNSTLLLAFALCAVSGTRGDVHLPAIFGDHMVLQQDLKLPVWGTADPGEIVEVSVGARQATATADKWTVRLDPLPVSDQPVEMRVTGAAIIGSGT